jgi:hypothetical protein
MYTHRDREKGGREGGREGGRVGEREREREREKGIHTHGNLIPLHVQQNH